jgi:hypothetical protein
VSLRVQVTSRVGTYLIPHNCQWGKHFADSTEVTRDVLAALLTTGGRVQVLCTPLVCLMFSFTHLTRHPSFTNAWCSI